MTWSGGSIGASWSHGSKLSVSFRLFGITAPRQTADSEFVAINNLVPLLLVIVHKLSCDTHGLHGTCNKQTLSLVCGYYTSLHHSA